MNLHTGMLSRFVVCAAIVCSMTGWCLASPSEGSRQAATEQIVTIDPITTFHVVVVEHTTKAVNYHFRSGATKVNLQGTNAMPGAKGTAKVESHLGRISLQVQVNGLDSPQTFGTASTSMCAMSSMKSPRRARIGRMDNRPFKSTPVCIQKLKESCTSSGVRPYSRCASA